MKLYKISQSVNAGWYTYDAAVVAANSKDEARRILPSPFYFYDKGFYYQYKHQEPAKEKLDPSWCKPSEVDVEEIGTTELGAGTVISSSFNAGFDESRYLDMRHLGRKIASGTMDEVTGVRAIGTLQALEEQLHDHGLAELRYHMIEANRMHDEKRTKEYELKVRDYMSEEYVDW